MIQDLAEQNPSTHNESLATMAASARVNWALETFGDQLVLSTSFGVQSAVMLHMATTLAPQIPIIFIDTGYHFPETYRFAKELTDRLKLNLKIYQPTMTAAHQEALYGKRWENGPEGLDAYNLLNKVEPMNRAIRELGAHAWMSGLRREQAQTRARLNFVEKQKRTWKVHPILDWDNRRVHRYLENHDLPYHPLWELGYVSIGDWHSTSKLGEGMTEEETRFHGLKRECGLHEESSQNDWQI